MMTVLMEMLMFWSRKGRTFSPNDLHGDGAKVDVVIMHDGTRYWAALKDDRTCSATGETAVGALDNLRRLAPFYLEGTRPQRGTAE